MTELRLTSPGSALELLAGEETGVHVSEGDEEEERVVLVVLDETDGVVGEERGQVLVLVRLVEHGGVPVQVAFIDVGEVLVKLSRNWKRVSSYSQWGNKLKAIRVRFCLDSSFVSWIMWQLNYVDISHVSMSYHTMRN